MRIADALSARSGVAVLKNPSDTGHEDELLAGFPDAQIIISRRRAAGITASSYRAMDRYITTSAYGGALRGDDFWIRLLARGLRNRLLASLVRFGTRWGLRARLTGYLRTFSRLPADRVAFLSYDELVEDPDDGARWAAHLLDAGRLSKEFRAALSADPRTRPPESSWVDRELDRRWARVWERKRGEQLRLGVLSHPTDDQHAGSASIP
ncbi:MAG: sulfotransferase [Streptosporangiaceae bacterium]|nr:sulfotransferase [Streptosporangiaceae bacterium]